MKRCYLFDLDGTVADIDHRLHHITGEKKNWRAFYAACDGDKPIPHMMELAHHLGRLADIYFVTGRSEECASQTIRWLQDQGFMNPLIEMRPDGDHRADNIVKGEMLDRIMQMGWSPIMAFEDRDQVVKMWRARGVPCCQVAPGDF